MSGCGAAVQFLFGDHSLDLGRRELRRGADLVELEPQVFDLLVYLVQNRDRIVTKDDLIAAIWGGRIVSESTLSSRITAVRKAIGDSGEQQALIRTAARKGIRSSAWQAQAAVRAASPARKPDPCRAEPSTAANSLLHRPSTAFASPPRRSDRARRWSRRRTGSVTWSMIGKALSGAACSTRSPRNTAVRSMSEAPSSPTVTSTTSLRGLHPRS